MTAAIFAAVIFLAGGVLYFLFDFIRERRDVAKHLDKIAQRKENYERFKQKKRSSQEVPKTKEK